MKRDTIFAAILEQQNHVIENLKNSIAEYKTASDLDEDDTIDREDYSHQSEAKDMELRLGQLLIVENDKLKWLEKHEDFLDERNQAGKIVITQDYIFLLGISMAEFPLENKKCIAISETAPLYKTIMNLNSGDSFMMGNSEEKVEKVF